MLKIINQRIIFIIFFPLFFTTLKVNCSDFDDNLTPPANPISKAVLPLIKAINSGDPIEIKLFAQKHFSKEYMPNGYEDALIQYLLSLHHGYGTLTFHSYRHYKQSDPKEVLAVVYSDLTETWQMISLYSLNPESKKIDDFALNPARWPSNVKQPKALTQRELKEEIERLSVKLYQRDVFSGTILLAKGEDVLFHKALGQADKAKSVDNTIDTLFDLASAGKMFTGVAINQLVEREKLNLTDLLSQFLDESWLPKSVSSKIQIQHLLTHTSGLGNYAASFVNRPWPSHTSLAQYKPYLKNEKLMFEPGTRQAYSNSGMFLLGAVVENVTGKSYFEYVNDAIFKPAKMLNTGFYSKTDDINNRALGYEKVAKNGANGTDNWQSNVAQSPFKGMPDGGVYSSSVELQKFALALANHSLLSPLQTNLMLSVKPELQSYFYGYGFNVQGEGKALKVGHNGGHFGISTAFSWYPNSGYIVVVLSNHTEGALSIDYKINQLLQRAIASDAK